jgi:hypothetical protein
VTFTFDARRPGRDGEVRVAADLGGKMKIVVKRFVVRS